jgi:hypothetical protein
MADGEVTITLGDRSETLRPTLKAARQINALGGFVEVFRRLGAFDLETYIAVVAAGTGKKPAQVEEAVYAAGIQTLTEPLAEFVSILANGGKAATGGDDAPGEA